MSSTHDNDARWRQVMGAMIRDHGPLFFHVAFGVLRNSALAEDACQQAFMKAWEHRDRLNDADALRAWLLRVVVNEGLVVLRRSKTERRLLENGMESRPAEPSADRQASVRESVLLALEELPEQTRLVVVLRIMEGRTGNEVKQMLGCSASEVSRRLHEGMDKLRGALLDWEG